MEPHGTARSAMTTLSRISGKLKISPTPKFNSKIMVLISSGFLRMPAILALSSVWCNLTEER